MFDCSDVGTGSFIVFIQSSCVNETDPVDYFLEVFILSQAFVSIDIQYSVDCL